MASAAGPFLVGSEHAGDLQAEAEDKLWEKREDPWFDCEPCTASGAAPPPGANAWAVPLPSVRRVPLGLAHGLSPAIYKWKENLGLSPLTGFLEHCRACQHGLWVFPPADGIVLIPPAGGP